ncbi:MAG: hypothetical protein ACREQ5_29580 [Candidatus Dormibacteria bacterium]
MTALVVLAIAVAGAAVVWHLVLAQRDLRRWNRSQAELEARRRAAERFWRAVEDEVARRPCSCVRRHLGPPLPVAVDPAVLRLAATLTHPDRHPAERQADATRVTAELLSAYSSTRR